MPHARCSTCGYPHAQWLTNRSKKAVVNCRHRGGFPPPLTPSEARPRSGDARPRSTHRSTADHKQKPPPESDSGAFVSLLWRRNRRCL